MTTWLFSGVSIQAVAMLADEGLCHRTRGLPRWERIGHPLDTLTTALCFAWLVMMKPTAPHALPTYIALSLFSCAFITKDEFLHAQAVLAVRDLAAFGAVRLAPARALGLRTGVVER